MRCDGARGTSDGTAGLHEDPAEDAEGGEAGKNHPRGRCGLDALVDCAARGVARLLDGTLEALGQ